MWHQRLSHQTAVQLTTITKMAAQVKEDAENNATVHCSLSQMVKELDKQGTHLRNQAEALTLKAIALKASKTEIDLKMEKIDT